MFIYVVLFRPWANEKVEICQLLHKMGYFLNLIIHSE